MRSQLILFALGLGASMQAIAMQEAPQTIAEDKPARHAIADTGPASAELLKRAKMWQSRKRDDLALETLDKLLRVAPDNADALAMLASLQLRTGQNDAARETLQQLRGVQPQHPAVAQIETQLRLQEGADKQTLLKARQLAKSGRELVSIAYSRLGEEKRQLRADGLHKIQSALALFRGLYRNVPPAGDAALEYWQLVADTEFGWMNAYMGLSKLVRDNPDNPRYELALAEHLSERQPVHMEIFRTFAKAADVPELSKQARKSWRRALIRLDIDTEEKLAQLNARIPLVREYLRHDPDDSVIKNLLGKAEARRKLLSDPDYQAGQAGLALLDDDSNADTADMRIEAAEVKLQRAYNARHTDGEIVGGMGLLHLRQGHHAEARAYFIQAQQLDPAQRGKWEKLAVTAKYWGLLREAKDAALGGEYPLAKQKLAEARQLLPRESAALIRLAKIHEIQAQDNEAERAYRQALVLSPNDREALEGLAALYLRTGREQEIAALQTKLPPAQRKQLDQAVGTAKADKLRQQAEQLLARHQKQEAIALYEQAVRMDENDPWLRYDLARLYAAQGQAKKGQALFDELLQRQPNNAEALYAMALFQSGQEQDMLALSTLERIAPNARSRNMSLLQRRLWLGVQKQRMFWLLEHGQHDEAMTLLHKIENTLGDDPDLTSEMADVYIAAGQDERAFALIGRQEEKRQDTAWQLRRARLLTKKPSKNNDAELAGLLERIAAQPLSAGQQRDLTDLRHLRAEWLRKQGRYDEAEEIYRAILGQHPADDDATLALIDTQIEAGETKAAQQQIGQAAASRDDPEYLAELLDRLIDTGDDEQAQQLAERILSIAPEHAPTLRLAGKLAQKNNRLEQAIAYRQRALHSTKTGGGTVEKSGKDYRILAEMLDENSRWLSAAFDWHTRTGTPGTSQLDLKETTLEWKEAAHKFGHPYARADLVQIDAGLLDLASYAGHTFGTSCLTCSGVSLQNAIGDRKSVV